MVLMRFQLALEDKMKALSLFLLGVSLIFCIISNCSATGSAWDKPVLIEQPKLPPLPSGLNKLNRVGTVTIRVDVDEFGSVSGTQPVNSKNPEIIDRFIQNWIEEWKYLPRVIDGETAGSFVLVMIQFDIANQMFNAPSPNSEALILPDAILRALAS